MAAKIEEKSVVLSVKTGGGAEAVRLCIHKGNRCCIEAVSLEIDKKKMVLPEPIKACGTTIIPVASQRSNCKSDR